MSLCIFSDMKRKKNMHNGRFVLAIISSEKKEGEKRGAQTATHGETFSLLNYTYMRKRRGFAPEIVHYCQMRLLLQNDTFASQSLIRI